jgi:hypothetical protein
MEVYLSLCYNILYFLKKLNYQSKKLHNNLCYFKKLNIGIIVYYLKIKILIVKI